MAGVALGAMATSAAAVPPDGGPLEEIVISASLRPTPLAELPQSVTVLDRATLRAAGVQHFEDVLGLLPGLSWASGTSRPRYFQLRGVGEIEQYQGAPNPSVGLLIDDIDFSGVGMPATLFDLDHIESCAARAAPSMAPMPWRGSSRSAAAIRAPASTCRGKRPPGTLPPKRWAWRWGTGAPMGAGAGGSRPSATGAMGSGATSFSDVATPMATTRQRCAASWLGIRGRHCVPP